MKRLFLLIVSIFLLEIGCNNNSTENPSFYSTGIQNDQSFDRSQKAIVAPFDNAKPIYPIICDNFQLNCSGISFKDSIDSLGQVNYYKFPIYDNSNVYIISKGRIWLSALLYDENHQNNTSNWIASSSKYDIYGNFLISLNNLSGGIYYLSVYHYYGNKTGDYEIVFKVENTYGIKQYCGDWQCNNSETRQSCPDDCPVICGDGLCTDNETPDNCQNDCPSICGDGHCNGSETCLNCIDDCPSTCGDGICYTPETMLTCEIDCPPICGDGICSNYENSDNCPIDCPTICGDGNCSSKETPLDCPTDCPHICGDGICSGLETYEICPKDCDGLFVETIQVDAIQVIGPNWGDTDQPIVGENWSDVSKSWITALYFNHLNVSQVSKALMILPSMTYAGCSNASDDMIPCWITPFIGPNALRTSITELHQYIHDHIDFYDIDGNGDVNANTDGWLIIRYLFGFTSGESLIKHYNNQPVIGLNAQRTTAQEISSYFQSIWTNENESVFDIDHNGTIDPLTDGILLIMMLQNDSICLKPFDVPLDDLTSNIVKETGDEILSCYNIGDTLNTQTISIDITDVFNQMLHNHNNALILYADEQGIYPRTMNKDISVTYSAYPDCGDEKCNGDETRVSCPRDCSIGAIYSISFNHDQFSYDRDAINARYDNQTMIEPPEWQLDKTSQDVIYIQQTNPEIMVQIKLNTIKPYDRTIFISATPRNDFSLPCVNETMLRIPANQSFSEKTYVTLNQAICDQMNVYDIQWEWATNLNEPLGISSHRIYVILDYPYRPPTWNPANIENKELGELPWTRALAWLMKHAKGSKTKTELISAVCKGWYNDMGLHKAYNFTPAFSQTFINKGDWFDLAQALQVLESETLTSSNSDNNCYDNTNAVITFSNLGGAQTWGIHLNDIISREILFIGHLIPHTYNFDHHHLVTTFSQYDFDHATSYPFHPDQVENLKPAFVWDATFKLDFDGQPQETDPKHDYQFASHLTMTDYCNLAFYYGTNGIIYNEIRYWKWEYTFRVYIQP